MRRILLLILWQFGLLFADVVTLNNGRQISGAVESGNTQELHVKVGDQSQTIDLHEVETIHFGVSPPPPATAPSGAPAQPNTLILKDGTRVAGRWWSIDATSMHFLVNNQLQDYPRPDVSGVTFGNATLPPPATSAPPPATSAPPQSAQPPAGAARPAPAPPSAPPSPGPAPQPLTSAPRPSASAPPPAPSRRLLRPEEVGMVYSWDGKFVTPLERTRAVAHGTGATQYWEIPDPQSRVRLKEASTLVFVLGLPEGVDPASYILFPLATASGGRRTQSEPGRRGGLVTWPVEVVKSNEATIITYALNVKGLPAGEYSFSPSNSNDGYCFGVDPPAPDQ